MATELFNNELKVKHLLKADPFGQRITVHSKKTEISKDIVENTEDFFNYIYVDAHGNLIVNDNPFNGSIDKWLRKNNNFNDFLNCMLFFIEGYAGCGKSTLVQHILYEVLNNQNYEYSYYNYDVGQYPEDKADEPKTQIDFIKYAILNELKKQIIKILTQSDGKEVYDKFLLLTDEDDAISYLDLTRRISKEFSATDVLRTSAQSLLNASPQNIKQKKDNLSTVIEKQLENFETYQLLCIDYLWRLSQYLVNPYSYEKYMYVCYDNLDSIINFDVLCGFKDQLISFRNNLSDYISHLNRNIRLGLADYGDKVKRIRPFVIFSTYRKITAIRSNSRNTELLDDSFKDRDFIKIIEVSNQYSYTEIAQKRIDHFTNKLRSDTIFGIQSDYLLKQIDEINLLKEMNFVKYTYAGLWNNNFRSCSNVLSELVDNNQVNINKCISLFNDGFDGHNQEKYCYYGASSLFLYSVCKLLYDLDLFDSNHLDLINIKEDTEKRKTALSRLVLTYIYNKNQSVAITEIFQKFERVFSPEYICKIIGQLLTRVEGEIWRRPIYYSKNALDNENDIESKLFSQYQKYKRNENYKYVEFKICECGKTYINAIVPHFEFYSIRINDNHNNIYVITNIDELKSILDSVYKKLKTCCRKQIEFANEYMDFYKMKKEDYFNLFFHPRTNAGNPQLHIERVIFSHIWYFNSYRMYLVNKKTLSKYDDFNDLLLEYIDKYLDLYLKEISVLSSSRNKVASIMKAKTKRAMDGEKYLSIEV